LKVEIESIRTLVSSILRNILRVSYEHGIHISTRGF